MEVTLLAFAQAQDQLGFRQQQLDCEPEETPRQLLYRVAPSFDPSSARVAVDCEYHGWDTPIGQSLEVAIIPAVSGG